ncbi:MAG: hypothetical protein IJM59_13415 [Proteobacteria bacterium]|nr:hypothetical protein [Pseudomonadota bacterium]
MIFEDSYITDAGQALITRATAGTKIIWGKCGCHEHTGINAMSDAQINALTTLNNPCALGQASSVFEDYGEENYDAKITCQCSNAETGCSAGQALAFGLWGKIEGDASEVLVAVARSGTHTPTTFPDYDGTIQTRLIGVVELTIKVQRGAASTITINPSLFALANDLQTEIEARQDLQERFEQIEGRVVTTHAYGSSTTGDEQDVYGVKVFRDGINASATYTGEGSGQGDPANGGGAVTLAVGSQSGGTFPSASFMVHRNSDQTNIGLNINQYRTEIYGPFYLNRTEINGPFYLHGQEITNGLAPTIQDDLPVISSGNILMIGVKRISSGGSTPMPISVQTGDVIQDGSNVYVYAVNYGGGDWIIDEYVRYIGHKFRLMSGGEVGVGNDVIALAMVLE